MFDDVDQSLKNNNAILNKNGGLCGMPFSILRQKALDVQVNMNPEVEQINNDRDDMIANSASAAVKIDLSRADSSNNNSLLWVEKFRPKNFLELLSDDGTNRTLLRWLKLWDKVVFNKEVKRKKTQNDVTESQKLNDPNARILPTEVNSMLYPITGYLVSLPQFWEGVILNQKLSAHIRNPYQ